MNLQEAKIYYQNNFASQDFRCIICKDFLFRLTWRGAYFNESNQTFAHNKCLGNLSDNAKLQEGWQHFK